MKPVGSGPLEARKTGPDMVAPAEEPAKAPEGKGDPPSLSPPPINAAKATDTLKVLAILVVLLVVCGVGAYVITANNQDDDKMADSNASVSHNHKAVIAPKLVCVMRSTPAYDKDSLIAYSACDYLVYHSEPDSFNPHVPIDISGVKIIVGLAAKDESSGDHDDSGQDGGTYYQKLSSWLGKKYAVMDLNIASDFSNAAAAGQKVRAALNKIKKQRDAPELAVLGVVVPAKDEDATRENGEKLDNIAKGALIVFQAHISSVTVISSCEMRLNEVFITKKNYEKLAEGISGLVAISTTVAIVKFEPSDPSKTTATDKCKNIEIMDRNDEVCGAMSGPMSDSGRNVENGIVYVYNTNASAQALFVANKTHPTASWKFNIAFFDVDRYFPNEDKKCPTLKLDSFYREGPLKPT